MCAIPRNKPHMSHQQITVTPRPLRRLHHLLRRVLVHHVTRLVPAVAPKHIAVVHAHGGYPSSQSSGSKKQKDVKHTPRKQPTPAEMDTLKVKKAWEVALAPAKNLPMTAIMMYMSGNSLQIFSIMMVLMAFKTPITGLFAVNSAFERFESDTNKGQMFQVKMAYLAMQVLALAVGVWKVNAMGLLPTTRSDWLGWETVREPLENAIAAL
ncbi:hypothetical protein BN1723_015526 [Verticillium longisporum]|uniref:ER membrane protein complex subunit 4 n=1 Tax=Verticillium longisporum TaxID=100787 RepID=A0A0G4MZP1_VERLO|nr:hypothetical protein BN1723_015526 [Verticillium longisporum]